MFKIITMKNVQSIDLKKYRGVMTMKSDAKFEEKLTCDLENDMRNMVNFHHSNWKSQNWHIDGIL